MAQENLSREELLAELQRSGIDVETLREILAGQRDAVTGEDLGWMDEGGRSGTPSYSLENIDLPTLKGILGGEIDPMTGEDLGWMDYDSAAAHYSADIPPKYGQVQEQGFIGPYGMNKPDVPESVQRSLRYANRFDYASLPSTDEVLGASVVPPPGGVNPRTATPNINQGNDPWWAGAPGYDTEWQMGRTMPIPNYTGMPEGVPTTMPIPGATALPEGVQSTMPLGGAGYPGAWRENMGFPHGITAQGAVDPSTGQMRVVPPDTSVVERPRIPTEAEVMSGAMEPANEKSRAFSRIHQAYVDGADLMGEDWPERLNAPQEYIDMYLAVPDEAKQFARDNPRDAVLQEFEQKYGFPLNISI